LKAVVRSSRRWRRFQHGGEMAAVVARWRIWWRGVGGAGEAAGVMTRWQARWRDVGHGEAFDMVVTMQWRWWWGWCGDEPARRLRGQSVVWWRGIRGSGERSECGGEAVSVVARRWAWWRGVGGSCDVARARLWWWWWQDVQCDSEERQKWCRVAWPNSAK
jgi:hypothetical protein